ncbi:hypothetical protein HYH03_008919 [Edaphochlamys debaryana]|uniref:Uncharacterized protein n=1 Tax=Edaphochlamys debaryana TaxID=47281 RepID=A0A835Y844_9CHLO|nr:hypothetical protein HYH03_008919 [Edaphochlamys debaryana]|eukprot:KAG2492754.1 hypothetical protein HYH03_008919 [Edaphochlamys debaryana]
MNQAALDYGAVLTLAFAARFCSPSYDPIAEPAVLPYIAVCGGFANAAEGAKLQPTVPESAVPESAIPYPAFASAALPKSPLAAASIPKPSGPHATVPDSALA